MAAIKKCPRCTKELPLDTEHWYAHPKRGWQDWCKACHNTYMRDYMRKKRHALGKSIG